MTASPVYQPNPELDLVLERVVDVPAHLIWMAWTTPEHLMPWFCPKPWQTVACEIDLRPGGRFTSVMRGPEGQEFVNKGCYLEVVENQRLVWTDALEEGYRPSANPFMSAMLLLEPQGDKTKYTAIAIHRDLDSKKKHEEMGFHQGWATALDQLVAYLKSL